MKSRLFLKLLVGFFVVSLGLTFLIDLTARQVWTSSLRREIEQNLVREADLSAELAANVPADQLAVFAKQNSSVAGARVTIIAHDGVVLADSESDPAHMENHAMRPEVRAAIAGHVGTSSRQSATVGIEYVYAAVPFRGGALRLAYPLRQLRSAANRAWGHLFFSSLALFVLCVVASSLIARRIGTRIERIREFASRVAAGDLAARVDDTGSDELSDIAAALNNTAGRLQQNFGDLESSRGQLTAVLNSMQEPVLAVSKDARVRWANGRMLQLLGPSAIGSPVVQVMRDAAVLSGIRATLNDRIVNTVRSQLMRPGRVFLVTAAPMSDGGAVCVLQEITEIEKVEKTRRDFIANMSHELRTPLTSILGYAEAALADETLSVQSRQFLEIMRRNANRMSRLAQDLLTLARVESGEDALNFRRISAAELLMNARDSFAQFARESGQPLAIEQTVETEISIDIEKLEQVFANLIENALRYGGSSKGVVLGAIESNSNIDFYVKDFGSGIASEHQPRIFERLYRVDKARNYDQSTGLGLAIAKHIVLRHGGRIWVDSELGHGSTFWFSVPKQGTAVDVASVV